MLNGSFSFVCMSAVCLSVCLSIYSFVYLSVSDADPSRLWLYLFKTIAQNLTTHSVNFNDLLLTCHKTSQMNDGRTDRQTDKRTDRQTEQTDRQTYESTKQQLGARWQTQCRVNRALGGCATKRRPLDIHNHEAGCLPPLSLSYLSPPYTLKTASQQCARVELDPVQEADGERATSVLCRCESVCVRGAALGVSSAAFRLRATPLRHQAGSKGFSTLQIKSFTANLCDIFFAIQISSSLLPCRRLAGS